MTVKLLDELDPGLVKRISCRNCASRLEYVQADVKETHGRDISGCADGCEYVDCPKCGKRAVIRSW